MGISATTNTLPQIIIKSFSDAMLLALINALSGFRKASPLRLNPAAFSCKSVQGIARGI